MTGRTRGLISVAGGACVVIGGVVLFGSSPSPSDSVHHEARHHIAASAPTRRIPVTAPVAVPMTAPSASSGPAVSLGSAPGIPPGAQRIGPLPGSSKLRVEIAVQPRNQGGLDATLASISTPGSPSYHHFLSQAQYVAAFGPTVTTIADLTRQLNAAGLTVDHVSPDRLSLAVSGSVSALSSLLHASFSRYQVADRLGYSIDESPTVTGALADDAQGIVGLSTLVHPEATAIAMTPNGISAGGGAPESGRTTTACAGARAQRRVGGPNLPSDLASAYGLSASLQAGANGRGTSIAFFELAPYASSDLATYASCYGIHPTIKNINIDGGVSGPANLEPTLDIEQAAALAPGAVLDVYQASPTANTGAYDGYRRIATDDTANVVSTSWDICEAFAGSAYLNAEKPVFDQMALQGQTVVSAAGDTGSTGCVDTNGHVVRKLAVNDPASQLSVTGVGGTTLHADGPPPTESVWNNGYGASGGGFSGHWSRPTWQIGPGTGGSKQREVPDLTGAADPATDMITYMKADGGWFPAGGTSAAAPMVAAEVAVADETCPAGVERRLGLINPLLYAFSSDGLAVTNDVTLGSNDADRIGHFPAAPGYDLASGLGSPSVSFLADLCARSAALTASYLGAGASSAMVITGANASSELGVGSTITLRMAASATLPSRTGDYSVAVANGPSVAPTQVSLAHGSGSPSTNVATLTLATPIPPSATVSVHVARENNPGQPGTSAVALSVPSDAIPMLGTVTIPPIPPSPIAPGAPVSVTAHVLGADVQVRWLTPASNGSAITSYDVTAEPGGTRCAATITLCTFSSLHAGDTYSFVVTATNGVGTSVGSAVAHATLGSAPEAPTGVRVTVTSTRAVVTWTPMASSEHQPVTFTAVASPGGSSCSTTETSCTITGLTEGVSYAITVAASGASGTSPPSTPVTVVPPTVVGASAQVGVVAYATSLQISWSPPRPTDGSRITGYCIVVSRSERAVETSTVGPTTLRVDEAGLVPGTTYSVAVTSLFAPGASLRSPVVVATTS